MQCAFRLDPWPLQVQKFFDCDNYSVQHIWNIYRLLEHYKECSFNWFQRCGFPSLFELLVFTQPVECWVLDSILSMSDLSHLPCPPFRNLRALNSLHLSRSFGCHVRLLRPHFPATLCIMLQVVSSAILCQRDMMLVVHLSPSTLWTYANVLAWIWTVVMDKHVIWGDFGTGSREVSALLTASSTGDLDLQGWGFNPNQWTDHHQQDSAEYTADLLLSQPATAARSLVWLQPSVKAQV